jgi:hypothetical protein
LGAAIGFREMTIVPLEVVIVAVYRLAASMTMGGSASKL